MKVIALHDDDRADRPEQDVSGLDATDTTAVDGSRRTEKTADHEGGYAEPLTLREGENDKRECREPHEFQ